MPLANGRKQILLWFSDNLGQNEQDIPLYPRKTEFQCVMLVPFHFPPDRITGFVQIKLKETIFAVTCVNLNCVQEDRKKFWVQQDLNLWPRDAGANVIEIRPHIRVCQCITSILPWTSCPSCIEPFLLVPARTGSSWKMPYVTDRQRQALRDGKLIEIAWSCKCKEFSFILFSLLPFSFLAAKPRKKKVASHWMST